ncbi:unnamed protein product [Rotaria sp. Silwood2]|nr:unnamed protein product [Rotaria sp. Silwood2]CAF4633826.1 unnamed protein product [Rotaria sp. Silwood2]
MTDNIEKQLTDATQSPHLFMKEDDVAMTKRYYKMLTREALQLQDIPASTISQLCSYSYSNLDDHDLLTSKIYNKIGDIWSRMDNFQVVLSCYKEALDMLYNN